MSKTLIFNGSPRKKGETVYLIHQIQKELSGEVMVVDAYYAHIKPCIDCRYCFQEEGCAIHDDMEAVYDFMEECDNIILASPVYFGELSGQLLAVLSRLQTYFSARFIRKTEPLPKKKKGALLLTAGSFGPREKSEDTAKFLLEQMNAQWVGTIYCDNTDKDPVNLRKNIAEEISTLAAALKGDDDK